MNPELNEGSQGVGEEFPGEAKPEETAKPDSPEPSPVRQPKVNLDEVPEFRKFRSQADRRVAERDQRIADLEAALVQYQTVLEKLPDIVAQRGHEDVAEDLDGALMDALSFAELQELRQLKADKAQETEWQRYWTGEIERMGLDPDDPAIQGAFVARNNTAMNDAIYQARRSKEVKDTQAEAEAKRAETRKRLEGKAEAGAYDAMPTAGGTPLDEKQRRLQEFRKKKQAILDTGYNIEALAQLHREYTDVL